MLYYTRADATKARAMLEEGETLVPKSCVLAGCQVIVCARGQLHILVACALLLLISLHTLFKTVLAFGAVQDPQVASQAPQRQGIAGNSS